MSLENTDTNAQELRLKVEDIRIGPRHRQDLGDIAALAHSIRDVGLLHPIVVTVDNRLVAGRRRLAAVRELGWPDVPARVVSGLDDALTLLRAERDENKCRKDFTRSEAVAIGQALEALEKAEAKARQQATQAKKGEKIGSLQGGGNLPPPSTDNGKTRDKVAEAVGMSGRTYEKAKAVVEAAREDPEQFGAVKEEMDRTGKVDPAYKKAQRSKPPKRHRTPLPVPHIKGLVQVVGRLVKTGKVSKDAALAFASSLDNKAQKAFLQGKTEATLIAALHEWANERAWARKAERLLGEIQRVNQIDGWINATERQPWDIKRSSPEGRKDICEYLRQARDALDKTIAAVEGLSPCSESKQSST